jgi:integrase/recombinase XerD
MKTTTVPLAALLQSFFMDRLLAQRQASPHTIASYRDTFRLLLQFAHLRLKTPPSRLTLEELDVLFIGAFLDHLEKNRNNSARSRNLRLTAIHSFFRYVAFQEPDRSAHIQRVLAIPAKRHDRALVDFLTRPEIEALLSAPDSNTWGGRRDHALLRLAIQSGLRLSELIHLRHENVTLGAGAYVRCHGKGRKERCTPLTKQMAAVLRAWMTEQRVSPNDILFPNARGGALSPDGVRYLLNQHVRTAERTCPSLKKNG